MSQIHYYHPSEGSIGSSIGWGSTNSVITFLGESNSMTTRNKLAELALTSNDRLLRKYNVLDKQGLLTNEGDDVVLQHLFEKHKDEIIAKLKKLEASEKTEKKKA